MKNKDAEKTNPCLKEQEQTYKCFHKNDFDKDACQLQIQNYNVCKGFWNSVRAERRRKGIRPHLPPVEDREKIKAEFFERFK
ncbi:coiled-coil-helix-coiled-coil-helix domain-containing protein 7 [Tenebrio molitor]|jgi:cytochrome c oxidase assembly protein subunit 23|uniref:coiled-coil-helix-coiled-coil-helix domain-containing protein 7 n=1 Tax=Tenebrio molitor TaxID=7067 RepID=UPI001C3B7C0D|nr:unnamed protein product [Tenebrio molitor]